MKLAREASHGHRESRGVARDGRRRRSLWSTASRRPGATRHPEPAARGRAVRDRRGAAPFPLLMRSTGRPHGHPGQCRNCHAKIFDEWNGSMMSNAWRDPVWRAAFLLLSRAVSTNGDCDTPQPPDGSPRVSHNPFAKPGTCVSEFDLGTQTVRRVASGIAARRVLLALPHADELRRQRSAAQRVLRPGDRSSSRRARPEVQPDVRQRHRRGLRCARVAIQEHRLGQDGDLLRRLPQLRDDARHAFPQLSARWRRIRARRRLLSALGDPASRTARRVRGRRSDEDATSAMPIGAGSVPILAPRHRARRALRTTCRQSARRRPSTRTRARCSAAASPFSRWIRRSTRATTRRCSCAPRCARHATT